MVRARSPPAYDDTGEGGRGKGGWVPAVGLEGPALALVSGRLAAAEPPTPKGAS